MSHMPPDIDARRTRWGSALWSGLLKSDQVESLLCSIDALHAGEMNSVVASLIAQLEVESWQPSRSAVGALRKESSLPWAAIPAVLGWAWQSVGRAETDSHAYALREAALALVDWQGEIATKSRGLEGDERAHAETVAEFLESWGPQLATRMLGRAHPLASRGAIRLAEVARKELADVTEALRSFLDAPTPERGSAARDAEYTKAAAIRALQRVAERLERERVEAQDAEEPSRVRASKPVSFASEDLEAMVVHELKRGSKETMTAALEIAAGRKMKSPEVVGILRQWVDTTESSIPGFAQLRSKAMRVLAAWTPPEQDATPDMPVIRLVDLALNDREPAVRAASVQALARAFAKDVVPEGLVEAVLADPSPEVRIAAIELLAARSRAGTL